MTTLADLIADASNFGAPLPEPTAPREAPEGLRRLLRRRSMGDALRSYSDWAPKCRSAICDLARQLAQREVELLADGVPPGGDSEFQRLRGDLAEHRGRLQSADEGLRGIMRTLDLPIETDVDQFLAAIDDALAESHREAMQFGRRRLELSGVSFAPPPPRPLSPQELLTAAQRHYEAAPPELRDWAIGAARRQRGGW